MNKLTKLLLLAIYCIGFVVAQSSLFTIYGTDNAATSAHLTVTATGDAKAYLCPDEYVMEEGASLTTWGPEAICSAIIADRTISGFIKDKNNNEVENATVIFNNGGPTVTTNTSGFYTADVTYGWSGTSIPSGQGYNYTPNSYTYTNVNIDRTDQDYMAASQYVKVSGHITWSSTTNPIAGVDVDFSNGGPTVTSDVDGYYEAFMIKPYSGTATPSGQGCDYTPSSIRYTNISAKEENQNYVGSSQYVSISGIIKDANAIPLEGADVAFSNGGNTVATDVNGYYEGFVTKGWSGTSTPSKTDYSFDPVSYSYISLSTKQENENYAGTQIALGLEDYISSLPAEFTILPAFPNPFNPTTTLRYGLDNDSHISIEIYDITGQLITTLLNEEQSIGWYTLVWNGTNHRGKQVPAGLYLSRIVAGNEVKTTKLMFLK